MLCASLKMAVLDGSPKWVIWVTCIRETEAPRGGSMREGKAGLDLGVNRLPVTAISKPIVLFCQFCRTGSGCRVDAEGRGAPPQS